MEVKKLLRTAQVHFPGMLDAKFRFMGWLRSRLNRPFEADFNALRLFPKVEGALFLDVGANRGQSTQAILMTYPCAVVHLFEPNPQLNARLSAHYRSNPRIVVNPYGLGDRTSEEVLYVPFYKSWMFDGLASFDEAAAKRWLRGRLYFYDEAQLRVEKSVCSLRRLDDLGLAPFFLKLDVQGYELKAIHGGAETLSQHEPILLIESPSPDVRKFLTRLGYQQYAFEAGRFVRGGYGRLNTFFITPSKATPLSPYISN
jgi:FkbM family methyltransferase